MAQFQLGSISTGTLRPEDLIPAFNNALTQIHDGHYYDIDEMMDDEADNAAEFGPLFVQLVPDERLHRYAEF